MSHVFYDVSWLKVYTSTLKSNNRSVEIKLLMNFNENQFIQDLN